MERWAGIEMKRGALELVVLTIFSIIGILPGGSVAALPRSVYLSALRLLRPAESALRRLIVAAARDVVLPSAEKKAVALRDFERGARDERGARFTLFDARKDFSDRAARPASMPQITVIGVDDWQSRAQAVEAPDALVQAKALDRRIRALHMALSDVPKQAWRLARWRARRAALRAAGKAVKFLEPLRPGWPPGHRRRGALAVHELLLDCDRLARSEEEMPGMIRAP